MVVLDEVQTLPCRLWSPLRAVFEQLVALGNCAPAGHVGHAAGVPARAVRPDSRAGAILRAGEPLSAGACATGSRCRCLASSRSAWRELPDWNGKRVLLTLNTRRSARQVRNGLVGAAKALGISLEFLTADVTPADRLKAIWRIKARVKAREACLVVRHAVHRGGRGHRHGPRDPGFRPAGQPDPGGRPVQPQRRAGAEGR